ncbi:hypothetical protein KFD70_21950 [Bacillus pfraonensis]|uniref:hypothetical protein n=1 Tax=Bacillus pfraonensis TaxID=2830844 RepID=UPI003D6DBCAD
MELELFKERVKKKVKEDHGNLPLDTDGWLTVIYECLFVYTEHQNEMRRKMMYKSIQK